MKAKSKQRFGPKLQTTVMVTDIRKGRHLFNRKITRRTPNHWKVK